MSKETILANIRRQHKRDVLSPEKQAELEARIKQPTRHTIPARAQLDPTEQIELFVKMAEEAAASTQRVTQLTDVPLALAEYILRHNLPTDLACAPALKNLAWDQQERLQPEFRAAQNGDKVAVTPAFAGIAETGTLLLLSSAEQPSTLNFLPDIHIAILPCQSITGSYEDAFDWARAENTIPRTMNLITGPSRSADIEQTLQLGAHGPVQLHILLIDP